MSKKKNNWQELEREEKQYKEDRSSKGDRVKQPYKRDRKRVDWYTGDEDEDDFFDEFD